MPGGADSGGHTGPSPEIHTEVITIKLLMRKGKPEQKNSGTSSPSSDSRAAMSLARQQRRRRRRIRMCVVVLCAALLDTSLQYAELTLGRDAIWALLAFTAVISVILALAGEWARPHDTRALPPRPAHCRPFRLRADNQAPTKN